MAENGDGQAAVYVAFTTFKNALDQLAQGVPNRVDRSVFPGLSGGVQAQLLAGMRFLGLIDGDGKPQPSLAKVAVLDEPSRKRELRAILEDTYADLFALNLKKTTPAELNEQMAQSYNVSGDTRDKAVRFFLSAAEYAGVPLSQLFEKKRGRTASASTPKRRRGRPKGSSGASAPTRSTGTGATKTVQLTSGGELTLSASIDLFALTADDRKFVFDLIDRMDSYEREESDEGQEA